MNKYKGLFTGRLIGAFDEADAGNEKDQAQS
jgi:hypothetical protein